MAQHPGGLRGDLGGSLIFLREGDYLDTRHIGSHKEPRPN